MLPGPNSTHSVKLRPRVAGIRQSDLAVLEEYQVVPRELSKWALTRISKNYSLSVSTEATPPLLIQSKSAGQQSTPLPQEANDGAPGTLTTCLLPYNSPGFSK